MRTDIEAPGAKYLLKDLAPNIFPLKLKSGRSCLRFGGFTREILKWGARPPLVSKEDA
jgi:hypothetical protein